MKEVTSSFKLLMIFLMVFSINSLHAQVKSVDGAEKLKMRSTFSNSVSIQSGGLEFQKDAKPLKSVSTEMKENDPDVILTGPGCGNVLLGTLTPAASWQQAPYVAGDTYYWQYTGTAGTLYSFSSCGSGEDTFIRIYDDIFNQVAAVDDNGPHCTGVEASIDWMCPANGTYYISLSRFPCEALSSDYYLAYRALNCLPPSNTATQVLSTTNARASWDAGGLEMEWNLEWGPTGFALGSGNFVPGLSADFYDFGNVLTQGTAYDWYVQADCGGETSPWVGPVTFATYNVNDFCANATSIGEVVNLPFATLSATSDGYNPDCGGDAPPIDIWYLYTPGMSGLATFDLCGSDFDTRIVLWEACPDGVISSLACNDDDCGLQSRLSYVVSSGESYYVQVGGYETETGTGLLSIEVNPIPANDECADAVTIPNTFPYSIAGTSIGATPDCSSLLGDFNGVWYEIPVENAFNCIQIDYCGTVGMDLGGIVLMDDCLCDDYLEADFAGFDNCPDPALHLEFFNVPGGPGQTMLFPALAEDADGNPIDFILNIYVVPASTAGIDPANISQNLVTGQNGYEILTIENLGLGCNLDYSANIVNYTDAIELSEDFESGTFPPAGWTLVNNGGDCVWYDLDALEGGGLTAEGNLTGATGNFADADSDHCGDGTIMDTELRTPVIDLSEHLEATLSFYHFYFDDGLADDFARVDVSQDGGSTWSNLINYAGSTSNGLQTLSLPVGSANTVIRFYYYAPAWDWYWQVDDVVIEGSTTPSGWLSLNGNPFISGSLLAGESANIPVMFDATGILPGSYSAQIEVLTSDPNSDKGLATVNVTMMVEDGISLAAKAYLEGPYSGGGLMSTGLKTGGYIPLEQPYNPSLPYYDNASPAWLYTGTESVDAIPEGVVDWVLVQLRDASDAASASSATAEATVAAFLMLDGSIVGLDGMSRLGFPGVTIDNDLFLVVYHRNHLGIISANPVLSPGGFYTYDFSTEETQAFGGANGHKELEPGVWGMIAADGNGNGLVQNTDETAVWKLDLGGSGYQGGDFDMNGLTQNTDETNFWKPNLGGGGQIPAKSPDTGYQSQIPQ
ncbi:MAG: choice-of-anchor J domain-containing protein [Bacteroidetes bacterium]|nr:choice-of-anchor J domain-containing protein [Bacteroidota bacterium]